MRKLRRLWRQAFDVRPGEGGRTACMALYFFFILCANNVLKPVAWSLFLNRFPLKQLPYLYILFAVVGGLLAYFYSKTAVRRSLQWATRTATLITVVSLVAFWEAIRFGPDWLLYLFSVWVSLFGIVFMTQGWLIAANLFDSRQAKRLYSLLGLGAILGGAAGGALTALQVERVGTTNLLPAGIVLVLLALGALEGAAVSHRRCLASGASAGSRLAAREDDEPGSFTLQDVLAAVGRHRHLLVIVGIIVITFVMEVLVEFQLNAQAQRAYSGDHLTAFLGKFNGVYLSAMTFALQFFFTGLVVGRLGVGRMLAISPVSVAFGAAGVMIAPGLWTAAMTRLIEASTRYSITRTAIELLYLPLPAELKNRTKAFVDVFVDRLGRGVAAVLLLALVAFGLESSARVLSLLIAGLAGLWILLAVRADSEYAATVRQRIESRRLDLEGARITVQDPETLRLLEQVARGSNERQVLYALSLLAEAPGYDPAPLLVEIAASPSEAVRAKVYETARRTGFQGLLDRALAELSGRRVPADLARAAVSYVLAVSPDVTRTAAALIEHPDCGVVAATLAALEGNKQLAQALVTRDWLLAAADSDTPERRAVAAYAVGVRGDEGTDVLHHLLADAHESVVAAACRAAGRLRNRDYLQAVVSHLSKTNIRRAAIESLVRFGEPVCEALGRILEDPATPLSVRTQIPRVLARIGAQTSVDVLQRHLDSPDPILRTAALKGLNRLREAAPELDFRSDQIRRRIRDEARSYFELYAALVRFRQASPGGKAAALLARTLEERLRRTIERLFRLLGLRYPQKQIHAAYLALSHRRPGKFAAALDFLDNILDHDLKSILVPMIDGSPHLLEIGREQFGVEVPDLETALRHQIRQGDMWLKCCAIAAAAELRLKALAGEIAAAAREGDPEVRRVAESAAARLA